MNFRTTLGKIRDLSRNFEKVFWQIREKGFSKKFRKHVDEFSENFRHRWSGHIMGDQLINSLLTGYKTNVSCDKASMSRDKKC